MMLIPQSLVPRELIPRAPVAPDFHQCTGTPSYVVQAADCEAAGDDALPHGNNPVRYDLGGSPGPFSLPWTATHGKV